MYYSVILSLMGVALRKESVDRNYSCPGRIWSTAVALRKESVDRNPVGVGCLIMLGGRSP